MNATDPNEPGSPMDASDPSEQHLADYLGLTDDERRAFSTTIVSIIGVSLPVVVAGWVHHGGDGAAVLGVGAAIWCVASLTIPDYVRPLLGLTTGLGAAVAVALELLHAWP